MAVADRVSFCCEENEGEFTVTEEEYSFCCEKATRQEVLLVSGDSGSGKSSLVKDFVERGEMFSIANLTW